VKKDFSLLGFLSLLNNLLSVAKDIYLHDGIFATLPLLISFQFATTKISDLKTSKLSSSRYLKTEITQVETLEEYLVFGGNMGGSWECCRVTTPSEYMNNCY
jgi:hypothetical protein